MENSPKSQIPKTFSGYAPALKIDLVFESISLDHNFPNGGI